MSLIQFIVVKRKGNWMVKFSDQERSFSAQQDAVLAAIELANECGKDGMARGEGFILEPPTEPPGFRSTDWLFEAGSAVFIGDVYDTGTTARISEPRHRGLEAGLSLSMEASCGGGRHP